MKFENSSILITLVAASLFLSACSQSPDGKTDLADASVSGPGDTADNGTQNSVNRDAAYVSTSQSNLRAYEGETFDLAITLNNLDVTTEGGGLSLRFDAAVLQVESIAIDNDVWEFKHRKGSINNVQGLVTDILFSSYQGVSGDATLATVTFRAVGKGEADVIISGTPSNPFASDGNVIDVDYDVAKIQVL